MTKHLVRRVLEPGSIAVGCKDIIYERALFKDSETGYCTIGAIGCSYLEKDGEGKPIETEGYYSCTKEVAMTSSK